MRWELLALGVLAIAALGTADINLHNPRGSNNRLNEATRPRRNANRVFDSQNNQRGGQNVGVEPMKFYSGSKLRIEWANQHSCGDQNNNCELIMQYMCGPNLRDGTTTRTPALKPRACGRTRNCDTDTRQVQHESHNYLKKCALRERNQGLFTADQKLRKSSAQSTRQNAQGTRRGYECPEERDYYPYWGPSPWKDIAVMTNNPERCAYYQQQSQNVQGKYECTFDEKVLKALRGKPIMFLNKEDCEASTTGSGTQKVSGKWVLSPAHGLAPPECLQSPWSRDNHQGNTVGGEFMSYDWTLPELAGDDEKCALRIRYNISTNDFDSWNADATGNKNPPGFETFGLSAAEAEEREYVLKGNPEVDVFGVTRGSGNKKKQVRLQLAINTAQYGRTFQDRSHVFHIQKRPAELADQVIHNVNVRGKRGNIVQVFPSVEYDFVPNRLQANEGDMIHYQWTGSNTNPKNNDGEGKRGTDRSNVIQMDVRRYAKGLKPLNQNNISWATNYPPRPTGRDKLSQIKAKWDLMGFGYEKTEQLALLQSPLKRKSTKLDKRSAYFNGKPMEVQDPGTFYYMCTRNNNFSNRDQKGVVYVG